MAWRLSLLETILSGNTVKAATIGAMEQAIVDLFRGDFTLIKVQADGTGDQASTASAGDVKAQRLVLTETKSGTSAPTSTVALGTQEKDSTIIGWAYCTVNGSHAAVLVRGFNVKSTGGNTLNGPYKVTFNVAPPNPTQCCIVANTVNAAADAQGLNTVGTAEAVTGNLVANVYTSGGGDPAGFVVLALSG